MKTYDMLDNAGGVWATNRTEADIIAYVRKSYDRDVRTLEEAEEILADDDFGYYLVEHKKEIAV